MLTPKTASNSHLLKIASMDESTFLQEVQTIIFANYNDPQFGVEDLAQAVFLSVSQLNRRLNQIAQTSAGKLIRTARLRAAASLLKTNYLQPVADIAYHVGYPNVTSFCRSFKREFGCSPRAYEKPK
ncbi:MAG: AraC family transcriptional regulator [Bacteroidota bacterium]